MHYLQPSRKSPTLFQSILPLAQNSNSSADTQVPPAHGCKERTQELAKIASEITEKCHYLQDDSFPFYFFCNEGKFYQTIEILASQ